MSYMIPVFAVTVDCHRLGNSTPDHEEAFEFLPAEYMETHGVVVPADCWESASHNWWHQTLLQCVCDAYPGRDEVRYLLEVVAVVRQDQLAINAAAIHGLIKAIRDNPLPFLKCPTCAGYIDEKILKFMSEAVISRDIDDQTQIAFGNCFSFLVSQAAALEEARSSGKCLLYFQPQP